MSMGVVFVSSVGYIGPVPGLWNLQQQALSYCGVGVNTISSKAVPRHCESSTNLSFFSLVYDDADANSNFEGAD
jgi:hypothetical protein